MEIVPTQKYFLQGAPVALAPCELDTNFSRLDEPVTAVKHFPRSGYYIKRHNGSCLLYTSDAADE